MGKGNNIELLGLQEAYLGWATMKVFLNGRRLEMSLWLAARLREMSLAISRWHAAQIAAVASKQAGSVPLPVTATRPNAKTMIGAISQQCLCEGVFV